MNRTTSESLFKNINIKNNKLNKKIIKFKSLNKKNYSYKKININNKKFKKINSKIDNNIKENNNNNEYKNTGIENEKVSMKIFDNLDKIQETLLEDFKKNIPKKNEKQNIINNNDNIKKENNDNINNNNVIDYFKKNNNNFYNAPIKSNTTANFFPISRNNNLYSEDSSKHNRVRSTENIKPQNITRYLERKTINDLPVTYPLFLSYNNRYNSISEKYRVDKILNKLICLKTHLLKDPLNKVEIIKEFFLKNGFDKNKYFTKEGINNFYNYLRQPFSFPPEYNLSNVINDGINYKYNSEDNDDDENNDLDIVNFLDYMPKNRKWSQSPQYSNKKKIKNKSSNEIIYNLYMEDIFKRRYVNYDNYNNKSLPILIKDLEYELKQIKIDRKNKLDKYNNLLNSRKIETIKLLDKNKYVPNLCLISQGFKEKCKALVDKKNKKIIKNIQKQEHIKNINNRLYYNKFRNNNAMEYDINDIQRKLKLTEFIVMERAKKQMILQNTDINFKSSLEKIGKKE